MALTYIAIATVTVGAGGASSIDFSSIPATYTDLKLVLSTRDSKTSATWSDMRMRFNSDSSSSYPMLLLYGDGTAPASANQTDTGIIWVWANSNNSTASTFSNAEVYIPNYTSSSNKSVSINATVENNATVALNAFTAARWTNSSAITSISITPGTANFLQHSSATLYGIKKD
jgi:hypothetical protein